MSTMYSSQATVQKLITPHDQFIREVFSKNKSYYIDIYQREYKWTDEQVKTLLNDLDIRFQLSRRIETAPIAIQKDVLQNFEPYFLNTYLTHASPAATGIVDGQQRLTTLLLMLIKLYKILHKIESFPESSGKTFIPSTLRPLIFEEDDFGGATRFKIFNVNRENILRALVDDSTMEPEDETQKRLIENYDLISKYFDKYFSSESDPCGYDLPKLTYYITYLLDRVSIVEIRIERTDNVAMIFEVVNDRGLGLKPYEILKGKFIGNLPELEKERCNKVWVTLQDLYYRVELKNTTEARITLDDFFRTFFRAKFARNETDYVAFERDYHYEIYRRKSLRKYFGKFRDHSRMSEVIETDIQYFARLYQELRSDYSLDRPHLLYNKLQDQNQQYLLIMSAVTLDDPQREEKIRTISAKFDQVHVILRLLGAYESNSFQRIVYELNDSIRNKDLDECCKIFDQVIISTLQEKDRLESKFSGTVEDIFTYDLFKNVSNNRTNFSKYLLMRIDRWLSELLDKPSYCSSSPKKLENRFNRSNRKRHGMHLEHIYAHNEENQQLFVDPKTGVFDRALFDQVRNYMGMVVLLQDSHNISSGNDVFTDKLNDYANSSIIWNEILAGHLPSVFARLLPEPLQNAEIAADESGAFPRDKVEQRQRIFFEAVKAIWAKV